MLWGHGRVVRRVFNRSTHLHGSKLPVLVVEANIVLVRVVYFHHQDQMLDEQVRMHGGHVCFELGWVSFDLSDCLWGGGGMVVGWWWWGGDSVGGGGGGGQ